MPEISNGLPAALPAHVDVVLRALFADYERLIITKRFTSGRSGSLVYLVRPLRADGLSELPTVAKIDHAPRIAQEWDAFRHCIQNRLPAAADVSGAPVYQGEWGGLRYPLAGAATFTIASLADYYRDTTADDVCYVLEKRLFRSLSNIWAERRMQPAASWRALYDDFLPPNLLINCATTGDDPLRTLGPADVARPLPFAIGDCVTLTGFVVTRVLPQEQALLLDLPHDSGRAFHIQVGNVPDLSRYAVEQTPAEPLVGRVQATRATLLQAQIAPALPLGSDLTAAELILPDKRHVPNPLVALPRLLAMTRDVNLACIHGDLNLQNVLVEPENRNAYLIDFVNAREDHLLRDFFHLEMAIVTRLLAPALSETADISTQILDLYERLHCAHHLPITAPADLEKPFTVLQTIRRTAGHYLSRPHAWDEYYAGVAVYLLGAMRYRDLEEKPDAKRAAFWAAAAALHLMDAEPACVEFAPQRGGVGDIIGASAVTAWLNGLFRWSEADDHMRSSWEGMVLWSLSALTGRISPRGAFAFFVALLLGLATGWLLTPVLQWPLADDAARLSAVTRYAAATLLIPLTVAVVTPAERQDAFVLETWRQRLRLFFLKLTGALVGFNTFAALLFAPVLVVFYLGGGPLPPWLCYLLGVAPLLMSHIAARRIPVDRLEMYGRKPQLHAADSLFFAVFLLFGPLLAILIYYVYALIATPLFAVLLLIALLLLAWLRSRR